jgi:tetratricopeptide (TPR) repeat protein
MLLDHRSDKESLDRAQALVERLKGGQLPQFLDTVGWALHLRGDHGAAKPMLEQAKSQLPNVPTVRFHLGLLYRALGDEPKATEELKAASLLETEESELKKKIRAALN